MDYKIMRGVKHLGINDSIYLVYKYIKDELNWNKKTKSNPFKKGEPNQVQNGESNQVGHGESNQVKNGGQSETSDAHDSARVV